MEKVKALLQASPELVSAVVDDGHTPLYYASKKAIARMLVACKSNVDAKENLGATPLHAAAWRGQRGG